MFSPPPPANRADRVRKRLAQPSARLRGDAGDRSLRQGSDSSFRRDSTSSQDLPDRSMVRKAAPAAAKQENDGVVEWTVNDKYKVARLPGIPTALKNAATNSTPATASADSTHNYALILSHNAAYVWKYTAPHTIPHTYSFPLPKERDEDDLTLPFPLGTLVSPSANSQEPGLVVVMPMTGRVAYWDAVGSAVAEGLFSKKRGVEGKVPLISSEAVTAICSIEPAGFILSLSSGRLAHLALRDQAGRPGVMVTIMRGYGGALSGFFGALRAGSARRDVVAVRAGKTMRMGEREVVVGTVRGNFSRWQVNRSGTYANIAEWDTRDEMLAAAERFSPRAVGARNRDQFVIVDVEIGSYTPSEKPGEEDLVILVLAAYMPSRVGESTLYVLSTVHFLPGRTSVGVVHIIKSYNEAVENAARPRLYFPQPQRTAFVVFPRAVVIVSLYKPEVDPTVDPEEYENNLFEDVIDFSGDDRVEIIGSGKEDYQTESPPNSQMVTSFSSSIAEPKRTRNPAVVLVAKGAGVVRVEAFDGDQKKKIVTAPLTVKNKIEQAVFFSDKEGNPLNFRNRNKVNYTHEEVERAALQISREIVSTSSSYLPSVLPSVSEHLTQRAKHLKILVNHLTSTFPPLSKTTMYLLLADAEKIEAARSVWAAHDSRLQENPNNSEGVIDSIIAELSPDTHHPTTDPVRNWFFREAGSINALIPLAKSSLSKANKGKRDPLSFARADVEANLIILGALMTAWDFRVANAAAYKLSADVDESGLLIDPAELPAPWTSEPAILQSLGDQYDVSRAVLKTLDMNADEERQELADAVADHLVRLAELCCRGFEERIRWCAAQGEADEDAAASGAAVQERYLATRGAWIKPLVEIDRVDTAYATAEKWRDFRTLVEMTSSQLASTEIALAESEARKADAETLAALAAQKADTEAHIERYFADFGAPFAREAYSYLVERGHLQTLLDGFPAWREQYLTPFLRDDERFARLAWIHDVGLGEYDRAATTLLAVATGPEPRLDNRRFELSIGKLAFLAAADDPAAADTEAYDVALATVRIQHELFEAVRTTRKQAIDTDAAVSLAVDDYAAKYKRKPVHLRLFKAAFRKLCDGVALEAEELADLLTMCEGVDGSIMQGAEFYYAIKALAMATLPKERRAAGERTVWRRCLLRDDWASLLSTTAKSDTAITAALHSTALYTTLSLLSSHGYFNADSPFKPLRPSQCRFSDPRELRARFPQFDEAELYDLDTELSGENKALQALINRGLEGWWEGLVREVLEGEGEAEAEGDEAAADVGEDTVMTEGEGIGDSTLQALVAEGDEGESYVEGDESYVEGDESYVEGDESYEEEEDGDALMG